MVTSLTQFGIGFLCDGPGLRVLVCRPISGIRRWANLVSAASATGRGFVFWFGGLYNGYVVDPIWYRLPLRLASASVFVLAAYITHTSVTQLGVGLAFFSPATLCVCFSVAEEHYLSKLAWFPVGPSPVWRLPTGFKSGLNYSTSRGRTSLWLFFWHM